MGIFSGSSVMSVEEEFDESLINEYQEAVIADMVSGLDDEALAEFCAPNGVGSVLVEAGKMRKKTLVRLGKNDDLNRRETMACLTLAKRAKDPLWDKLALNRVKEKELLGKIKKKYGSKGSKLAKAGQKDYIKNRMPKGFNNLFGAKDR